MRVLLRRASSSDAHLAEFVAALNFARRLKTLSGLTPYVYIAKVWTSEPDRFIVNPIHQMPGLNSRNRIEIMFDRLKDWRGIATGYDQCPTTFFSAIALAATVIFWL